jgi:hypothetical protein
MIAIDPTILHDERQDRGQVNQAEGERNLRKRKRQ